MRTLKSGAAALAVFALASGCASHKITSAAPDGRGVAGQPFEQKSTSFGGRAGVSTDGTGYVTRDECGENAITEVEVRRDVGQTFLTLLTLGVVSPATFYFYCAEDGPPPPCDCEPGSDDEF